MVSKKKKGTKPNISNRFYPIKTPVTTVMIIKIGIKHGKYNIDIICKPNQKIFGQRMYQDR